MHPLQTMRMTFPWQVLHGGGHSPEAGTEVQPHAGHKENGRNASHSTRKREVCLHTRADNRDQCLAAVVQDAFWQRNMLICQCTNAASELSPCVAQGYWGLKQPAHAVTRQVNRYWYHA